MSISGSKDLTWTAPRWSFGERYQRLACTSAPLRCFTEIAENSVEIAGRSRIEPFTAWKKRIAKSRLPEFCATRSADRVLVLYQQKVEQCGSAEPARWPSLDSYCDNLTALVQELDRATTL